MYMLQVVTHCFCIKLLFVLYFVSITTYEDVSDTEFIEDASAMQELSRRALSDDSLLQQKIILYPCPKNFENIGDLCIKFIYNTTYPPECPYEETVPFNTFIDQIDHKSPIWMPVRRNRRMNGIGLFHWMEPNALYKSPFDPCKDNPCEFDNKSNPSNDDCVIYHNSTRMEAVSCNLTATAVCAYDHLQKKTKSFCSQSFSTLCKQSDFSTKSKCFCLLPTVPELEKAEFLEPYQNLVYHSMSDEMCYIGIKNTGTSFIWTSSNLPVNYKYWAVDTDPTSNGNTFGAISSDGWTLRETDSELNYTLSQQNIPTSSYPNDMLLYFNDTSRMFNLKLTNPSNWLQRNESAVPLIFCFSDASAESLLQMLTTEFSEGSSEILFEPINNQTGNYWCEGFVYPELEVKISNEYQLKSNNEEYVVILKFIFAKGSDPLCQSNLRHYKQLLDQTLVQTGSTFFTRIFKIVQIDVELSIIRINFHISSTNRSTDTTNLGVLRKIFGITSNDFTFIHLLSVHFCLGMQVFHNGQQVTWTATNLGEVAEKPLEGWCVDGEGHVIKRRCEGNFVDGAQWAEFQGMCTIVSSTNTTINLTSIVRSENPTRYLEQMVELTTNYNDFSSSDVALVSDFLGQLARVSTNNVELVAEIVNNLGSISLDILKESQLKYQSRDKILQNVEEIIRLSSDFDPILGKILTIASFKISSINTLILTRNIDSVDIEFSRVMRPEAIEKDGPFDSALFVNQSLLRTSSDVLKVLIYNKPIFFGEENESESTRTIYRLLFSHSDTDSGDFSVIYQNKFNNNSIFFHRCSSWNYGNESIEYWKYQRRAERYINNIICNFNELEYSRLNSVQLIGNTAITTELERIKNSSYNSQYTKLKELRDLVSTFGDLFQPTDLHIISEILSQVQSVEQDEFNLIADIIDSTLSLNQSVISQSQSLLNVPELLLTNLKNIMKSYGTSIEITRRNFFLLVFFINNTADTEFIINTCSEFCSVIIVSGLDTDTSQVSTKEVEMSVILSIDLVKQLRQLDESKLMLTVFNDDLFFVSKDSYRKDTSKIVGVHFPNFDIAMNGEIRIEYQTKKAIYNQSCELWHETYWVPESYITGNNDDVSQCNFWKTGYYSLRFHINITYFIEEQMKADNIMIILKNLEEIVIKYHHRFTAYDLKLITDIFDGVDTVEEETLSIISRIVSVIMKIDRVVLEETQEKYQTTDKLLNHLEILAGMLKLNQIFYYYESNLLLMISSVKQSAIVGVEISNCENECRVDKLFGNGTETNNPNKFDITSVRLNQDLFKKLLKTNTSTSEPKMVIIAFNDDSLFNSKDNIGHNGIIFGVNIVGYDTADEEEIILYQKYPYEGYCVRWNIRVQNENKRSNWEVEGRMADSTCSFQRQGYLGYKNEEITTNITKILESILKSSSFNIDKLQELKGISYLYDMFKSIDVSLLSKILLKIMDQNINLIEKILQNMLSISKNILIQSQVKHNALSNVLKIINSIGNYLPLNTSYTMKNQFSLIVCSVDTGMSAVFDDGLNSWCTTSIDGDYFGRLSPRNELVADIFSASTDDIFQRFIFTLFHDNTLFIQDQKYISSVVLGLEIPNYNGSLDNKVMISLKEANNNYDDYSCAYWEYIDNSYGIWWPVKTLLIGAYRTCTFSHEGYFSLIKKDVSKNLTKILLQINDSNHSYSEKLHHTLDIIDQYKNQLKALHISIISTIMGRYDQSTDDLTLIGNVTSSLMDVDRNVLVQSQNLYNATNEILYHIDTLVTEHIKEDTNLQFNNFALLVQGNFNGLTFENCDLSCTIKILSMQLNDSKNIDGILSIDQELKEYLDEHSMRIYITIYYDDVLFNEGCTDSTMNVGIVVGVTIPGMDESIWKEHIRFGFKYRPDKADICAYWNWNYEAMNGSLIKKGHWEITPAYLDSMWLCTSRLESTHFAVLEIEKNITSDLESIFNSSFPIEEQLERVDVIINTNTDILSPMDIFLIAKILGKMADYQETTHEHVILTSKVMSGLFRVKRTTLRKSQELYYATDTILYYLDQIMLKRRTTEEISDLITEDNFTVITYKLSNSDIQGFRLEGCEKTTCNLTVLHRNMDSIDTVGTENLNTAVILTEDLLQQIKDSTSPIYLIVTVFFQDVLFNEKMISNYSMSLICGVLLKGLNEPMRGNLSMVYKVKADDPYDGASCAYWDYKPQIQEGYWKGDIVPKKEKEAMVCNYPHITHFVLLLASSNDVLLNKYQNITLDIITNINSILSLLGIFGILLTALMFDRWRNNTGNQILIHFSFAISIKNIMLYISVGIWDESGGSSMACTITGGILHYSILSEFGWMLIIAILQFKRFVEVLGSPTKYILLKACICGWAFPAIPVFLIIIIDVNNYSAGQLGLCYPSGLGLYLGIWLPLLIIICINTIIFIVIIYNVFHKKTESRDQVNHEILFQWRLALLLFFMLGLTWLFGFLSLSGEYFFMVVFCFCATLQGFVMFMFFIVFNKSTRYLYIQTFRSWLYSNGYRSKFI
ncbi:unnamed protein product [Phaedon cochleariae]|uniref:G-protein coupled receptors family 2 profile 2 domain-containing protein n=1 Tax=Phaedon cochleariae TaxID=80249 RepID=A0A9N9SD84_PHACE|nr:unnamed protein product [Phaedon cochleariae]